MPINNKKLLTVLVLGIAILVFLTIILILRNFSGGGEGSGPKTVIELWGVFDERSDFDSVIRSFQAQNPNTTVVYKQFSYDDYEKEIINALASGAGPDVWMFHNTWLPKHVDKITTLSDKIPGSSKPLFTFRDFQNQFVDVAVDDLTADNKIYALPLYVDTLALYYNKDIFNSAGITRPPENWDEFNDDVENITKLDSSGNIIKSGAALGTSANVNRSTDILAALMIQSGIKMTDDENSNATFANTVRNTPIGEIALRYYTDFANPGVKTYTWNNDMHYSVDAFTEGNVAMMLNYSHQAGVLSEKASRFNYGIAPLPQVSSGDIKNYANYWAVAVSKNSSVPNEAWKFLIYLTSKEGALEYLAQTNRPSARRDIIDLQKNDLTLGVFANQSLTAKSWYQIDSSAIETIFAKMIDDVNFGRLSVREAIQNAESEVNVLMSRFRRAR